jgi:hypothetical protein
MTVHCTLLGTMLTCPSAAHAIASGPILADWVRWAGVVVAIIGTAVAAPAGTALIWRRVRSGLQKAVRKVHVFLARFLPFLRRSATVHGVTAMGKMRMGGSATATVTPGWDPSTSLESQVQRLHEQMVWVYAEIDRARQDARDGDAELRQLIERHAGELQAADEAHRAEHRMDQRRAASVDAHGIFLLGLSVIMTGIPDELARFPPLGWLFAVGGPVTAVWVARRVWAQRRGREALP